MLKYVELDTKNKTLVRYDIEGRSVNNVEVFRDGEFVHDFEITGMVTRAAKFGVMDALGRELTEEEANKAVSSRIADYLDKASEMKR